MGERNKDINTVAIEYMEQKYGEAFEYSAPTGDSLTGTHAMLVRCQSLPEAVYVEIENYRRPADRVLRDNYIAVKYKQETIDFLVRCAEAEFDEANIFYSVTRSGLSPDLLPNAGFEEFLRNSGVELIGTIEVKDEDGSYKERAKRLAQRIADSGVQYSIMLAVMDANEFGIYDYQKLGNMVAFRETKDSASMMNRDGSVVVTWRGKEG